MDRAEIVTLLGEGTAFAGDLTLDGGARIDGRLSGRINSRSVLVVGASGEIEADELRAAGLTVCGNVRGKLAVSDRLEIRPGGCVRGHVVMDKRGLVIAPGGVFEGVVEYTSPPEENPGRADGPELGTTEAPITVAP